MIKKKKIFFIVFNLINLIVLHLMANGTIQFSHFDIQFMAAVFLVSLCIPASLISLVLATRKGKLLKAAAYVSLLPFFLNLMLLGLSVTV
jgi:hypothetical protein